MNRLISILFNIALLFLTIFCVEYYNQNPRILIYAFLMAHTLKILTIEGILLTYEGKILPRAKALLPFISSPPPAGIVSEPFINEQTHKPIGLFGYMLLMGGIFVTIVLLLHVNRRHALNFKWSIFLGELCWGMFLAMVYWIGDLASRSIRVDANQSRPINFGYNNREVVIIAFAVLLGAVGVMIYQMKGRDPTPWVIYLPMLVFKQIFDLRRADKMKKA